MRELFGGLRNILENSLTWLIGFTGSAGLAVILLTVLIRLALYPLDRWSLRATRKMQALAPQIAVLRRKHKDDPRQLNVEIMNLYRSSGANPMGGCLPVLLQWPVLLALWQVLQGTAVFKGQTFLGVPLDTPPCSSWIPNLDCLSAMAQNPIIALLPILVGVTTFFQQRLAMTDPQQARLFAFMPIMLGFFSLGFPAALSLYWVVSSAVYAIETLIVVGRPPRPAPALQPSGGGSLPAGRAGGAVSGGNRKATRRQRQRNQEGNAGAAEASEGEAGDGR